MVSRRACDICYRKKASCHVQCFMFRGDIQCSIPTPGSPCDWCSHHGMGCTFNRERPRRGNRRNRVTLNHVQELRQRIQQLEDAQSQAPSQTPAEELPSPTSFSPFDDTTVLSAGGDGDGRQVDNSPQLSVSTTSTERQSTVSRQPNSSPTCDPRTEQVDADAADVFPARNHLGPNWFFDGIPLFSERGRQWLSSRTGQVVDWTKFRVLSPSSVSLLSLYPNLSLDELFELPDKPLTQRLLAVFFRSSFRVHFPLLDRVLTDETVETAYKPVSHPLSSPSHISARACVLSALSIACRLKGSKDFSTSIDAGLCAVKAHRLLQYIAGEVSVETLQTVLNLHVQQLLGSHWQESGFFLSVASRMVTTLGGHIYRSPSSDGLRPGLSRTQRLTHHTRTLFWLCYISDKDLSLRTGNVPLLTETHCDLTLPEDYSNCYATLRGLDEDLEVAHTQPKQLTPCLPGDPSLSHLKEKVYRTLYSASALRNTDGLLSHIRHLDDDIEQWRLSIPADFRPVLVLPSSSSTSLLPPEMKMPHVMHYVHLQLEYHHLMTVIHTTVRRYNWDAPGTADGVENFHTVIHSSADLSLEASRSTLGCLRELITRLGEQAFRFVIFYPATAAISLFLNMIAHPCDEEVQLDLERFVSSANVIRSMPEHDLTQDEVQRLRDTSDFIMGLVWLGTSAILKAKDKARDGDG